MNFRSINFYAFMSGLCIAYSAPAIGVSISAQSVTNFLCAPVNSWGAAGKTVGVATATVGALSFFFTGGEPGYGLTGAVFGFLHSAVALALLKVVPNNPYVKAGVFIGLPLLETYIGDDAGEKMFLVVIGAASSLATLGALNYMNA